MTDIGPAQIVFGLVRVSWVTAFCCWVAGWLLLASSARDATAKHWACHAISIGHALSAVSSHLLAPPHEDGEHGKYVTPLAACYKWSTACLACLGLWETLCQAPFEIGAMQFQAYQACPVSCELQPQVTPQRGTKVMASAKTPLYAC